MQFLLTWCMSTLLIVTLLIACCKRLMAIFGKISLNHIFRECNMTADAKNNVIMTMVLSPSVLHPFMWIMLFWLSWMKFQDPEDLVFALIAKLIFFSFLFWDFLGPPCNQGKKRKEKKKNSSHQPKPTIRLLKVNRNSMNWNCLNINNTGVHNSYKRTQL